MEWYTHAIIIYRDNGSALTTPGNIIESIATTSEFIKGFLSIVYLLLYCGTLCFQHPNSIRDLSNLSKSDRTMTDQITGDRP